MRSSICSTTSTPTARPSLWSHTSTTSCAISTTRVITIESGSVVSDTSDTDKLPEDYASIEANYPTAPDGSPASEDAAKNAVLSDTTVEPAKSTYYIQPNVDKDLEDFMQNYGLEDLDLAEDNIDYSAYLDNAADKNGGESK